MVLITSFSSKLNDGGAWVTRKLCFWWTPALVVERGQKFLFKAAWAMFGIIILPFLHPTFTRYIPIFTILRNKNEDVWLNFSQTFAAALFCSRSTLVCHDLQCHRRLRFKGWVRWSERLLLSRARQIVVLSARDEKLIQRYYGIDVSRIVNIGPRLSADIMPFEQVIAGPVRIALFLGALGRRENRDALTWFVANVLPSCPALHVHVVGAAPLPLQIQHSRVHYLGFVDDLEEVFRKAEISIAPMLSNAGVKIKVIESLQRGHPVLGTREAYSGLLFPSAGFRTNQVESWCRILSEGGRFRFPG